MRARVAARLGRSALLAALVGALLAAGAGCNDLGAFAGSWSGPVTADPALVVGLPETSLATLRVEAADRAGLVGTLSVGGETVRLRPVVRAMNDALGALELPDAPLRSYWLVAPLAAGDALAVVSLYGDERIEVRLLRGDALYGLFHLRR